MAAGLGEGGHHIYYILYMDESMNDTLSSSFWEGCCYTKL